MTVKQKTDEAPNENEETRVVVLRPSLPDPREQLTAVDTLAWLLLQGFIKDGYPAVDPMKQVDAAYTYAELMNTRRKK